MSDKITLACPCGYTAWFETVELEATKTCVRWTCPQCERIAESSTEEVEKA